MPNKPLVGYYGDGVFRWARLVSLGAHASTIEYHEQGMLWQVLVSNDDIEIIGDDELDDED